MYKLNKLPMKYSKKVIFLFIKKNYSDSKIIYSTFYINKLIYQLDDIAHQKSEANDKVKDIEIK